MNSFDKVEDPRRRELVQMLTVLAASLSAPAAVNAASSIFGTPPSRLPPNQSIYRMSGNVTVNGVAATLETRIFPGDTVQTGSNSEIVFVVGGNSMIVRADSNLVVQAQQGTDPASMLISGLRLLTGKLLSVHGRGNRVQMSTVVATIGIRGTGVYLEADPDQTYVCTCYGVTDIAANNDPDSRETVTATHHDKPLYVTSGGGAGNNIRRAPFINHTDQELQLIETLVGRQPPFVFPGNQYNAPRRDY